MGLWGGAPVGCHERHATFSSKYSDTKDFVYPSLLYVSIVFHTYHSTIILHKCSYDDDDHLGPGQGVQRDSWLSLSVIDTFHLKPVNYPTVFAGSYVCFAGSYCSDPIYALMVGIQYAHLCKLGLRYEDKYHMRELHLYHIAKQQKAA